MDINSLERFVEAQERIYPIALREIKNGEKYSHWMWFIFPQLRGFGRSRMSYVYGISGVDEAVAYLSHPILSSRLYEISEALLEHTDKYIEDIMGDIDAVKLRSSMTLFAAISEKGSVFHRVLDCFYGGKMDVRTLRRINR